MKGLSNVCLCSFSLRHQLSFEDQSYSLSLIGNLSLSDSQTLLEGSPLRQTTGAHMECLPASVSFQKLSALNTLLACRHVLESALTVTYIFMYSNHHG